MRNRRALTITLAGVLLAVLMMSAAGCARRSPVAQLFPTLAREFEYANRLIRHEQQPDGYWFTPHTTDPVFTRTTPEINVFVPAIIVELLTPIADETGLGDVLQRARSFLGAQIEETGLVRYHGRTTQPYLPQYGCAISPDADDTATVWAVAPPPAPEPLARSVIQTFKKFRSDEGLYRTWLADQADYMCIDVGRDPNPPDIVINMRVHGFFTRYQPEAAPAFCNVLRRTIGDNRFWVYYEMASPLVPMLLGAEVSRGGCTIQLPDRPMRQIPPNQAPYLQLGRLYRELRLNEPSLSLETVVRTLAEFGKDDFRQIATAPPLLYHNDLTATTSRSYWSVEMGVAVWLRLYVEAARRWPGSLVLPIVRGS